MQPVWLTLGVGVAKMVLVLAEVLPGVAATPPVLPEMLSGVTETLLEAQATSTKAFQLVRPLTQE
jgi:hypothetical protein